MQYLLIEFLSNNAQGYQEVCRGNVIRYTDLDGNTVDEVKCRVILADPIPPSWALPDPQLPDVKQPVPSVVSMRQAQLALLQAGLLNSIQSIIDSMPEPGRSIANIEWNKSSEVHRYEGFALTMASLLNLTEDQLDDLFILAGTL